MSRPRGFTLIELMITVVIVAILATVALPSYRSYVVRTNRVVAKTLLSEIAQQQESWFGDRKTYAANLGTLGYPVTVNAVYIGSDGTPKSGASSSSTYRISLAAPGSGDLAKCSASNGSVPVKFSYVIIAEPQGAQATGDTACGTICLYSTGQRGATIPMSADDALKQCWTR